jgi:DNA processing protein
MVPVPAEEDLAAWIRLEQTSGIGPDTARKLLAAFGLPENIFSASLSALQKIVSQRIAQAIIAPLSGHTQALIDKTIEWANQPGNHVLTLADAAYPKTLLDIADPPLMLYVKGRLDLLSKRALAIVGSRNATAQGVANARDFAEVLSRAGLTVVSGMALGIDTAAHQGSLHANNENAGSTIAVIGTGADIVYPARNRMLAHQIAQQGCIVSEYSLGMPAIAANFPRRNRIISGLAHGVLVVEAAAQSGSLITARMALEQGRDVFAIPGSIHSPLSKGCHQLIKQGAKLVESAQDILEELGHYQTEKPPMATALPVVASSNSVAQQVFEAMGFDPVEVNMLAVRIGVDIATIHAQLLALELEGLIEMLPNGVYRRLA